jgi:hypothetical protein
MNTELPESIKSKFKPFETIGPSDHRYMADPHFVAYPDDHLRGWQYCETCCATEDGSEWLVRTYSPINHGAERGHYDVIFCRLTNNRVALAKKLFAEYNFGIAIEEVGEWRYTNEQDRFTVMVTFDKSERSGEFEVKFSDDTISVKFTRPFDPFA